MQLYNKKTFTIVRDLANTSASRSDISRNISTL